MSDELVSRLRDRRGVAPDGLPSTYRDPLCHEAADAIESRDARIASMREKLEALVDACEARRVEEFDPNDRVTVIQTRTKDIVAFHEALDDARQALTDTLPKGRDTK